jgi:nicotinamidase-related amidase
MLKVQGPEVLDTLAEIADPAHTALLIIDVQHDFCSPDGLHGSLGKDLTVFSPAVACIRTVICTGVVTQGCVESTARDAVFMEGDVVALEDAVATYEQQLQDASLTVLRTRVDVAPLGDVLGVGSGGNWRRE